MAFKLRVRNRKISFLISQPKYIVWVLKRTFSKRRFIRAPQKMLIVMFKKNFQLYAENFCLSRPVVGGNYESYFISVTTAELYIFLCSVHSFC